MSNPRKRKPDESETKSTAPTWFDVMKQAQYLQAIERKHVNEQLIFFPPVPLPLPSAQPIEAITLRKLPAISKDIKQQSYVKMIYTGTSELIDIPSNTKIKEGLGIFIKGINRDSYVISVAQVVVLANGDIGQAFTKEQCADPEVLAAATAYVCAADDESFTALGKLQSRLDELNNFFESNLFYPKNLETFNRLTKKKSVLKYKHFDIPSANFSTTPVALVPPKQTLALPTITPRPTSSVVNSTLFAEKQSTKKPKESPDFDLSLLGGDEVTSKQLADYRNELLGKKATL